MYTININGFDFKSGDSVTCEIDGVDISDAKIFINGGDIYICHSNRNREGNSSPDKLGYPFSWVFRILDDGTLTDNVKKLSLSILSSLKKRHVTFSNDLDNFIYSYNCDIMKYVQYEIGLFPEYTEYHISDKLGFIKMSNDNRSMEIKIGRMLKQIPSKLDSTTGVKIKLTDSYIESMVNSYISFQNMCKTEIEYLVGRDILMGYTRDNQVAGDSTLNSSCMNDKHDFLQLYTNNPNKVKLAIIKSGGKIAARALVWETEDGKRYDRVYYRFDWQEKLMKSKLESVGITSIKMEDVAIVKLDVSDFEHYPYLDSLYIFDKKCGRLIYINDSVKHLRSANG